MDSQSKVMFAPYDVVGDSFRAENPRMWSPTSILGARSEDQGGAVQDRVVFFFNFADYLRKIAPGS